jgi:hypothetical protein
MSQMQTKFIKMLTDYSRFENAFKTGGATTTIDQTSKFVNAKSQFNASQY